MRITTWKKVMSRGKQVLTSAGIINIRGWRGVAGHHNEIQITWELNGVNTELAMSISEAESFMQRFDAAYVKAKGK